MRTCIIKTARPSHPLISDTCSYFRLREPFAVYVQGGIHWSHWAIVLREALSSPEFQADDECTENDADGGDSNLERYAGRRGLRNT